MEQHRFRRPAMLSPQEAEEIVGDTDPAEDSLVAHDSAWAMLGVPSDDLDADAIGRLAQTIAEEGPEAVAGLWDRSPAFTLPGALWRIYLLWQWHQLNPDVVEQRFDEGRAAADSQQADLPESRVPSLEQTLAAIHKVLTCHATEDDLVPVLSAAALTLRVMAYGITYGPVWVTDDADPLAHPVTRRPRALLDTAAELEEGARQARRGTLD